MDTPTSKVLNKVFFHSLFLPLKGRVVFASFTTLLSKPQNNSGYEGVSDPTCFQEKEPAAAFFVPDTKDTCSPLFASCGERADAIVCVLEDRRVVLFDLTDEQHGPKEIRRLRGTSHLHGFYSSVATCASMIHLDTVHKCRISIAATQSTPEKTLYLRGVVGSSDGRVDVFSEHGYVFGFVAYDAPLEAVYTIYINEEFEKTVEKTSSSYGIKMDIPGCTEKSMCEKAIANLGFVTCSSEGVVYVWRPENLFFKPRLFEKSLLLSRRFKFHVFQPYNSGMVLGEMNYACSPIVVYTTPGCKRLLCARNAITFENFENSVELPGNCLTRTTAIACDDKLVLIARGKNVYSVVSFESSCKLLFTARGSVTDICIDRNGIAAATCKEQGVVYFLALQSLVLLGHYSVRGGGPIRSVSLHFASWLATIVNGQGAVEVVLLPEEWRRRVKVNITGALNAAGALRCLVELQQQNNDTISQTTSLQCARVNAASREQTTYESLFLSRISIPNDTRKELSHVSQCG